MHTPVSRLALLSLSFTLASAILPAPAIGGAEPTRDAWLDKRFVGDERALYDSYIGYAPPAFTSDLKWPGGEPLTWESLRGKVVVVQSWTSKTSVGRVWAERVSKLLAPQLKQDCVLIALHVPEGASQADAFLAQKPIAARVAIDASGEFCKALSVRAYPVNFVVDRDGIVRHAGLTAEGAQAAASELLKQPADPSVKPEQRPAFDSDAAKAARQARKSAEPAPAPGPAAAAPSGDFPPHNAEQISAKNMQGQKAPPLKFGEWISPPAQTDGKVVIIDCWATWCGPCIGAIPHMSAIAKKFGDSVAVVGVSNESAAQVRSFTSNAANPKMTYAVAADQHKSMGGRIGAWAGVRGIPHVIVISPDGVVRWQGHPMALENEIVEKIILASGLKAS